MLQERNVIIKNGKHVESTKNKNIMQHAQEHSGKESKSNDLVGKINQVGLWKKLY